MLVLDVLLLLVFNAVRINGISYSSKEFEHATRNLGKWKNDNNDYLQENSPTINNKAVRCGVYVTPKKFDEKNHFMEFKCSAQLDSYELLSWYQWDGSKTELLNVTQSSESHWTNIQLKKTLVPSDNGTEIYCEKQNLLPNRTFLKGEGSERIQILFHRQVKGWEPPSIRVSPNEETIYYDVGGILQLNCSGTLPVDGRRYTWFLIDSESKLTVPEQQLYDATTNVNPLRLPLGESNHKNQLYCAQEWHAYIHHKDKDLRRKTYGELVRSGTFWLIERGREVPTYQPTQILALVVPLVLVAVVALVVVVLWRKRSRGRERCDTDNTEDVYACTYTTGELTYAALNLSNTARSMPEKSDANYASIIGVLIPTTETEYNK